MPFDVITARDANTKGKQREEKMLQNRDAGLTIIREKASGDRPRETIRAQVGIESLTHNKTSGMKPLHDVPLLKTAHTRVHNTETLLTAL